jgi:hypothetical protein
MSLQGGHEAARMDAIEGVGDVNSDQRENNLCGCGTSLKRGPHADFFEDTPQSNRPLILRSNDF